METITHHVDKLPASGRSAAEQLVGHSLRGNERLIIQVLEMELADPCADDGPPAQTLEDWARVYDGLSDAEIEEIDVVIKTRANLTRNLP